ncbi:ISKra4 family transposase [Ktedonobacter racemifer]|uniref:ISKra4 family transposase n=1 Tax=Ktedonobacter racemifer DSM 44963 TaxID=485913 RepID=D6U078_KTERA|nr:ISKra4 family transposase [Ktedonobacter racemifer]EFH82218.1 hypothetical protein Krac_3007 [Ktedonobacter racemifer DSM 44963]
MSEESDQGWQQLSEQILTDIKEWRRAHPKATFREIEHEVHRRLSRLEAQVIQDAVQESEQRDWSGAPAQERPSCPVCGTPLQARGKRTRCLQGAGGQEITLTRTYGTCPTCGTGLFPLDEELALPRGSTLTSLQHEHLVHLSSWMPFAQAAKMMERLLGVQVSEASTRRQSERAGALALAVQTAQAQMPVPEHLPASKPPKRLAISADGAYVPLLKGQWAEVRTVALGQVEHQTTSTGAQEVHVHQLSYFSRMCDAQTFASLAEVEMRRRGVSQAQEIGAVTDGADWLQGFLDLHCPQALRVLDFPHAAEHLNLLIQALHQAGLALPADLLERACHRLKHRGPHLLIWLLSRLPADLAQQEGVREQVGYFLKREALMQYPHYRKLGWPIGSGMVESANKVVVEARLKGAGMHWEPSHVNPHAHLTQCRLQ